MVAKITYNVESNNKIMDSFFQRFGKYHLKYRQVEEYLKMCKFNQKINLFLTSSITKAKKQVKKIHLLYSSN